MTREQYKLASRNARRAARKARKMEALKRWARNMELLKTIHIEIIPQLLGKLAYDKLFDRWKSCY